MDIGRGAADFKGTFAIYQDPDFARIVARHYRLEVVNMDGLIALIRKDPLLGYTKGLLGSPEIYGLFDQWWKRIESLHHAKLEIHTTEKIDTLDSYCISPEDNHNMLIDLSVDENELFRTFCRRCQKAIRSGIKKGLIVREGRDDRNLKRFYQICLKISDGGSIFKMPPYSLVKDLFESQYGKLFLTYYRDKIIGGLFFLLDRNMYGWIGGIDRDFTYLTPGNLMHFEAMKWGVANSYSFYDMGEQSLSGNPGLTKFKLSFAPLLKPAYVYDVPKSKIKILLTDCKKHISSALKGLFKQKITDVTEDHIDKSITLAKEN